MKIEFNEEGKIINLSGIAKVKDIKEVGLFEASRRYELECNI